MTLPAPGSTVYVSWYGKTLQGEVVPDDHRVPLFASMVHVRIPIQGTPAIAVFTPAHVYTTADGVPSGVPSKTDGVPSATMPGASAAVTAPSPSWSTPALDAHRARYRQFKADHWDEEHNRLRVDALEEFYQLFREGVALRQSQHQKSVLPQTERKPLEKQERQGKINHPIQLELFDL